MSQHEARTGQLAIPQNVTCVIAAMGLKSQFHEQNQLLHLYHSAAQRFNLVTTQSTRR